MPCPWIIQEPVGNQKFVTERVFPDGRRITTTRTHTRYFDSDMLRTLADDARAMSDEWDSRSPYIDAATREAGDTRIAALMAVILLCDEAVS